MRRRFLVAYQATRAPDDLEFRAIEIRSRDKALRLSTVEGYYP